MASLNPLSGTLGIRLAKHLLRRTTYNVTKARIDALASMSVSAAVDSLFSAPSYQLSEPIDPATGQGWINTGAAPSGGQWQLKNYVKVWWLNEALHDTSINSKMTMFLHQYNAIHTDANDARFAFDYLRLIQTYALGNFKTFALKLCTDNIMSDYLDNRWNNKWNPNENFAREFMELFTIGKGPQIGAGNYTNYTEADVHAAARLFTGWRFNDNRDNIDPDTGLPRNTTLFNYHDTGDKIFSSAFGGTVISGATDDASMWTELATFVDMIFAQDETARNICRRLYRYFVSWNITAEIETDIIEPLATTFRTNNYNFEIVLKQLLKSQHFYDSDDGNAGDEHVGKLIKSPLETVLQTLSFTQVTIPSPTGDATNHYQNFWWYSVMDVMLEQAGFHFMEPDNVAGYPAYYQEPYFHRSWFSSATMVARYKVGEQLLTGQRILSWGTLGGVQLNSLDFIQSGVVSNPTSATTLVTDLCEYLFAETPVASRLSYYRDDILVGGMSGAGNSDSIWLQEWIAYQSGQPNGVENALDTLLKSLIYSQEYQLM